MGIAVEPIVLGEDEYFVMGDNRNNSTDSRTESVGNIHGDDIVGRAWVRIWPLSKLGLREQLSVDIDISLQIDLHRLSGKPDDPLDIVCILLLLEYKRDESNRNEKHH